MSVRIPSNFDFDLSLSGIPTSFTFAIPTQYGITVPTNYTFGLNLSKIQIGVDPIEIRPIDLSFRIKEIPSVRVHMPVDFKVGFGLFGCEIASVRLCGQGQVITEPYVPNPCECRGTLQRPPTGVTNALGSLVSDVADTLKPPG